MRILLITVVAICPSAVLAGESARPADNPECKEITARLVQATDAQFDQIAPDGNNVFLQHPLTGQMVLSCYSHNLTGVSINLGGPFPPNAWFALAVKAGQAVTGEGTQKLDEGLRKCHRDALKAEDEFSGLETPKAKIECQAFTRDGGGTAMDIWIDDDRDEPK